MERYALLLLSVLLLLFASCREEQKGIKGCTDPKALNYDPSALKADSASCKYPEEASPLILWSQGEQSEWNGQEFLGVIGLTGCKGTLDTMTLNPNDTTDPGPFSMLLKRNSNDRFGFVAELTNERDLSAYDDGELRFKILDPDSSRGSFEFQAFVHGHLCNNQHHPCEDKVCSSRYVNVSTRNLNDSTMRTVSIPVPNFEDRSLEKVDQIMGIRGAVSAGSDTVFAISEVRLVP